MAKINAYCNAIAAGILFLSITTAHAQVSITTEASTLLTQGKAKEAYQLLLREEASQAGIVEFDYLLGRSALDSGEAAKATLIFERVLAVDPNHAGARIDMGRAYYALGDFPRAKNEFESLKSLNPPPAAQTTIDHYLEAIANQGKVEKTKVTAYTELAYGRDSNVTVGPRTNTLYFPALSSTYSVGQSSSARGDNYHQLGAGAEITHHLDDRNAIFLGTDLRFRNYNKIDAYDQLSGELRGGWMHTRGNEIYRTFASFGDFHLGDERYRETVTIGADWRKQLSQREQLSLFAQGSRLRYVQSGMDSNNYDQYLFGAGWTMQPAVAGGILFSGSAHYGREKEYLRRTDGNKNFLGLRGVVMAGVLPEVDLFGTASAQYGVYDRTNTLYNERRNDRLIDFTVGALWKISPGWSLRPQISWTRNASNTTINEYERTEGNITLRKDF